MARAERVELEVEAALFSAGDPVSVEELAETADRSEADVRDALETLRDDYEDRTTALEVAPAGDKWVMQVQTDYAEQVRELAPMEVPDKTLKTLALIAYHQPLLQSDLQTMVGSRVYDHVRELASLGLVTKRRQERTYVLRTTDKFPEYFGLDSTDPDEIREALAEAAGVPSPADVEPPGDGDPIQETLDEADDAGQGDGEVHEGEEVGDEAPASEETVDGEAPPPASSP